MAKPPVNWSNVDMLTPGMKNLGNQFNRRWPDRYGDSDGAQGDYAHQQGTSDHNPDDTQYHNAGWDGDSDSKKEIRAIDVDKDLNDSSCDMQDVIDHMRKLPNLGSVIRYMIYDGKMYHVDDDFEPTNYTGSNDHSHHAHFSGARSQSSDENTTFDFKFEEVGDMALTDDDAKKVAYHVWNYMMGDPETDNTKQSSAGWWQRSSMQRAHTTQEVVKEEVAALAAQVQALTDLVESHIAGLLEGESR